MINARVRLVEQELREPKTDVEGFTLDRLRQYGETELSTLVRDVTRKVFRSEISKGGAVLDLGLFGPELFQSHVLREIKAQDGILWKIEQPER